MTRFGFDMYLDANAYQLFADAFEKGSKDFSNRAVANLYSNQMRQGEGALDLLTRVQVATRCAELVAIAPETLGDPVGKIHPAVVPSSGIGVFVGALNSFEFSITDRVTQQDLIA